MITVMSSPGCCRWGAPRAAGSSMARTWARRSAVRTSAVVTVRGGRRIGVTLVSLVSLTRPVLLAWFLRAAGDDRRAPALSPRQA
jgi:hypothetical protein